MAKGVSIEGLPELRVKLKLLPDLLKRAARATIEGEVGETANDVREKTPIGETGHLKESTQGEVSKKALSGKVAITASYATFVIHGTSRQHAQDYVTPVIAIAERRFPTRLVLHVNEEIGKL